MEESDDEYSEDSDDKPLMKKPSAKLSKFDWSSEESGSGSDDAESGSVSDDDDNIKRDKNDAAWFKDNEHLLTPEHAKFNHGS